MYILKAVIKFCNFLFQQSLGDLCKGIVQNEVKLTVEVHADETISMLNDHMDESQAFYSLCSDRDESYFGGDSFLPTE